MPFEKVVLFGTAMGIEQLLGRVPADRIAAIVGPSIRQHEIDKIRGMVAGMGIPFFSQPVFKSAEYSEFCESVRKLEPDSIISNAYSMIIRPDILQLCNYNAINIHWSLLPANRGPNPVQWALLKDQAKTGVTAHFINEGVDTGDIILAEEISISDRDTWVSLSDALYKVSDTVIEKTLHVAFNGISKRISQDEALSSQNFRLTPDFPEIDFSKMDDRYIFNLIRAQVNPLPGAYIVAADKRIYFSEYVEFDKITKLREAYGK